MSPLIQSRSPRMELPILKRKFETDAPPASVKSEHDAAEVIDVTPTFSTFLKEARLLSQDFLAVQKEIEGRFSKIITRHMYDCKPALNGHVAFPRKETVRTAPAKTFVDAWESEIEPLEEVRDIFNKKVRFPLN